MMEQRILYFFRKVKSGCLSQGAAHAQQQYQPVRLHRFIALGTMSLTWQHRCAWRRANVSTSITGHDY